MFFKSRHLPVYGLIAVLCFMAGWACNKYASPNNAGIPDSQVVATVDGHNITFGDWMHQVDLTRVFITPIDANNSDEVKEPLTTLIDQQVELDAAQKTGYSDPNFDANIKNKLLEASLKIKETKDSLQRDMATVERLEKNYQDAYQKMLLAQGFAMSQVKNVIVTDKDMRDWYSEYSAEAEAQGQPMPPYDKVKSKIAEQAKPMIQLQKYITALRGQSQVTRNDDIIQKYLGTLSPSEEMLGSKTAPAQAGMSTGLGGGGK